MEYNIDMRLKHRDLLKITPPLGSRWSTRRISVCLGASYGRALGENEEFNHKM